MIKIVIKYCIYQICIEFIFHRLKSNFDRYNKPVNRYAYITKVVDKIVSNMKERIRFKNR